MFKDLNNATHDNISEFFSIEHYYSRDEKYFHPVNRTDLEAQAIEYCFPPNL
jgi:hypothetical protein